MKSLLPHADILNEIQNIFLEVFPSMGMAVSGSVAKNMHTEKSDIDLLVVDPGILKSFHFVFEYKRIKINVLCFNLSYIEATNTTKLLISFNPVLITYVLNSKKIYDPNELIESLKSEMRSLLQVKEMIDQSLLTILSEDVKKFLQQHKSINDPINKRRIYLNTLENLLFVWYLKQKKIFTEKSNFYRVFEFIKERDIAFYTQLKSCFPVDENVINPLEKMTKTLD